MMQVQAFNCTHANSPVKGRTILKSAAINCRPQVLATILSLDLGPAAGKGKSNRVVRRLGLHHFFHLLYCLCAWDGCAAQRSLVRNKDATFVHAQARTNQSYAETELKRTRKQSMDGVMRCVPMASDVFFFFFFFARTGRLKGTAGQLGRNNPSLNHRQNSFLPLHCCELCLLDFNMKMWPR